MCVSARECVYVVVFHVISRRIDIKYKFIRIAVERFIRERNIFYPDIMSIDTTSFSTSI